MKTNIWSRGSTSIFQLRKQTQKFDSIQGHKINTWQITMYYPHN